MKPRKLIMLIGGLVIAWPLASYAQQLRQPLKRVGILASAVPCPLQPDSVVVRRLAELGWVEGQNFVFECVSAVGRLEQLPALAQELVSRRPDVLMAVPYTFVIALKRETTSIPIVMLSAWEPVRFGLVTSLARPGGNVTGVAWYGELLPKQMELLKEIVPHLRRVALIQVALPRPPEVSKVGKELLTTAAESLGLTWEIFQVAVANDYGEIFARLAAEHFDAAYIVGDPLSSRYATRIGELAVRHLIPTVGESADYAKSGLLLTYGQDLPWSVARGAEYVDKILRGATPSDLPVEQATKVQLVINLKTAKAIGLTVPPSLLARADEVIE
jgi:putative ABC transport system substrate-binding protein